MSRPRYVLPPILAVAALAAVGCGDAPLTDEQGAETVERLDVRTRADLSASVAATVSVAAVAADEAEPAVAVEPVPDPGAQDGTPSPGPGNPPDCHEASTRHPIVLAHGMGGFDHIGPFDYWVGIADALEAIGAVVHVTRVDWLNGSDIRGLQLAAQLDDILSDPCVDAVNLVGHSQGGLDARYVVNALGYGDVVASITTVGTPHRGLWLSDVGLGLSAGPQSAVIDAFADLFDFAWPEQGDDPSTVGALWWTSTTGLAAFADEHPDDPGVPIYAWAGVTGLLTPARRAACADGEEPVTGWGDIVSPLLSAQYTLNGGAFAATDGLVAVEATKWGRFRGCVTADHLDQIGQVGGLTDSFDHLAFYQEIAGFLADQGH